MLKYCTIYLCFTLLFGVATLARAQEFSLKSDAVELTWQKGDTGYNIETLRARQSDGWCDLDVAKYQHNILYSPTKPESAPQHIYDAEGREIDFPGSDYRYIVASWQQNISTVALNSAGKNIVYSPSEIVKISDSEIVLKYENHLVDIVERWSLDSGYEGDICVTITLRSKKQGYYSIATPSLVSLDKYNFEWATIPGIFQGNAINSDFIRAFAYGQGIPDAPIVTKDRTASTLSAMITNHDGVTIATTAEPGTGRDPWALDKKSHSEWMLGLSVMNRDREFTPVLYHPVLGQKGSFLEVDQSVSFSFRYTIKHVDWHEVFKHVVYDVYRFNDFYALKQTTRSLTERLYNMHSYLVSDSTSMWNIREYKGVEIGAQNYLGGVHDSDKDAMKNSDYGAMWMLAKMTDDPKLTKQRLPYAINFKLMQQHSDNDFFHGAAAGQYYLYKSEKFTEEWGPYSEPIATTYYMLMDIGNILLFEPDNKRLKQALRSAADRLLEWIKPNGQWEVAYDNRTNEPMFTDLNDLRPTFYGLIIAHQILKDDKYLQAAIKGADWYVENAVDRGHFVGVCGDTRFAPDFATAQSIQALLELYDITKNERYKQAAISAAKIYTTSIYTHPIPTKQIKKVKGSDKFDWEISQVGLNFEHGGVLGSANHRGPILLASHAATFVRIYSLTKNPIYLDMARIAALGRDAFVDSETGVASYYWDTMNAGSGPFPHHAWWQIGWITDYLLSEVNLRSEGKISFPRGFITPKVGPHQAYGFASGRVFRSEANLIMRAGLFDIDNPYIEYVIANNERRKELYLMVLNNDDDRQLFNVKIDRSKLFPDRDIRIESVVRADRQGENISTLDGEMWSLEIDPFGMNVLRIKYK